MISSLASQRIFFNLINNSPYKNHRKKKYFNKMSGYHFGQVREKMTNKCVFHVKIQGKITIEPNTLILMATILFP